MSTPSVSYIFDVLVWTLELRNSEQVWCTKNEKERYEKIEVEMYIRKRKDDVGRRERCIGK